MFTVGYTLNEDVNSHFYSLTFNRSAVSSLFSMHQLSTAWSNEPARMSSPEFTKRFRRHFDGIQPVSDNYAGSGGR
jgi:hypothetical protein